MTEYYFVGIAGTAMASVVSALKKSGHAVWGSDSGVYPPMSTFLEKAGIRFFDRFDAGNIVAFLDERLHSPETAQSDDRVFVIGNAVSRGNPEVEEILNRRLPHVSLAALVGERFIANNTSLVIAGTHGKTTTASLAAWVLEYAGRGPGFLIGAIPENFGEGCRPALPGGIFVTEGDEYDTAFFDKRAKFVHYRPDIVVINNVEYDHADIFDSLGAVKRAFQQLVALVPGDGTILVNGDDEIAIEVTRGSHSRVITFGFGSGNDIHASSSRHSDGGSVFSVGTTFTSTVRGDYALPLAGQFNVRNALAVIGACSLLGLSREQIQEGFTSFLGVKRRMEVIGEPQGITVIDDFAHHPTAVRETVRALGEKYPGRRIVCLFEPRSNTTSRNVFQKELADAFEGAGLVIIGPVNRPERYREDEILSTSHLASDLRARGIEAHAMDDIPALTTLAAKSARTGDVIVLMSNGKFGGAHRLLLELLSR